jgi:hypothetical protein
MTTTYRRTQTGTLIMVVLGGALLLFGGRLAQSGLNPGGLIALLVLVACVATFASLTVRVDDRAVRFVFGIGLLRRTIPLAQIRGARPVRNPWYWGLGIHRTPAGWLYNVSGLEAVELTLSDGQLCRIGSDDATHLAEAIAQALAATGR